MKKLFYACLCSMLLMPAAMVQSADAKTTDFAIDLPAWSAMTSAELQTYLLGLPETDFIKAMQAIATSPQLEFRTRALAAARSIINKMPLSKRTQVAERLQSASSDLRVSVNAAGEASFYTLQIFVFPLESYPE